MLSSGISGYLSTSSKLGPYERTLERRNTAAKVAYMKIQGRPNTNKTG